MSAVLRAAMPGLDLLQRRRAAYALDILLDGIGIPYEIVEDVSRASLIYSDVNLAENSNALWIRADRVPDWDAASANVATFDGLRLPFQKDAPTSRVDSTKGILPDLVYPTYAMATGAFERECARDEWGVPIAAGSFLRSSGLLDLPVIAAYARYLEAAIRRRFGNRFTAAPRWPGGKRYAIVLSHDVDVPLSEPDAAFHYRSMLARLREHAWRHAAFNAREMAHAAVRARLGRIAPAHRDPNFCFNDWLALERATGTTSCFYVAVTRSCDRGASLADVTYDYRHPAIVAALRHAIDEGWEIGLHASIRAKEQPSQFRRERTLLESVLGGYRLRGVRHHYWAVDGDWPERTLRAHAEAGFEYDSSLGLNDVTGFRRGMVWPYAPYDRERDEILALLEVPPSLMDGAIFYHETNPAAGRARIHEQVRTVREYGGALVVDWHVEQLNPKRLHGAGPALAGVLAELTSDTDIYWASPGQLVAWWQERSAALKAHVTQRRAQASPLQG